MKILFKNPELKGVKVSIILIDWSVRESFHILDYLNSQTVERNKYEIIWIEYYDRKEEKIEKKLKDSVEKRRPILDKWILLEMPKDVYYHKHLMFNIGIILSEGEIICIPDSDAMLRPTFVETIIKEFEKKPNIVLHIDEIRNKNKKFYPFNYPSFEEVLGKGRIYRWDGKTDIDKLEDPIHLLNYGACMCARKEDLIKIGGADEHIDYLGHICGVYEMTFRLKNYGLKEVWSKEEFLYHTYHPGEGGSFDYYGPQDGLNMSTTSLNTLITKRVLPLKENKAINFIRINKSYKIDEVLKLVCPDEDEIEEWKIENLKKKKFELPLKKNFKIWCIIVLEILKKENLKKILKIIKERAFPFFKVLKSKRGKFLIVKLLKVFLDIFVNLYWHIIKIPQKKSFSKVRNWFFIFYHIIKPQKIKKIYLIGKDDYTDFPIYLAKKFKIKIEKLDFKKIRNNFSGLKIENNEKVLISCFKNKEKYYNLLKEYGFKDEDIILP